MMDEKKRKIIIIDDDKDMCETLQDILLLSGEYDVSCFHDPIKALDVIEYEDFSLVIIDYKMPEMDGIEVIQHIKDLQKNAVILMLTAFISKDLISQAKEAGALEVLSKVLLPSNLLEHIRTALK